MSVIIGNLCMLIAMGFNAVSATRKTPKGMLWMQNLSQLAYFGCAVVLRGYSAAVQNVVSILRNLAAIRNVKSKFVEWVLIALGVILGILCNNRGLLGLLPVIGTLEYTLAVFRFKDDERKLKICFLFSLLAFSIFNFVIQNYVGVVTDGVVVVTTIIALAKSNRE